MKKCRTLYILKYLWRNTDEDHPATTAGLLSALEADGITVNLVYEGRASKVTLDKSKLEEIETYYIQSAEDGANENQIEESKKAIAHLEMNLKIAEQAKDIAANLKRETKNVVQEQPKSRGLPLLGDVARTPQKQSADFRQRQILTKKIYTRTPKSQCITPRERKKIMKL